MKKIITLISLIAFSSSLFGFGLPSVPGTGSGDAKSGGGAKASQSQDALVRNYKGAALQILRAQQNLMKAWGQKDEADKLALKADDLEKSGKTSKQDLAEAKELSDAATGKISEMMASGAVISEEGKVYFKQSLPHMAKAVKRLMKLGKTAKNFVNNAKKEIKSAGLGGALKLKQKLEVGMFVAPKIPGLLKDTTSNFKLIVTYGKEQKIITEEDEKNKSWGTIQMDGS